MQLGHTDNGASLDAAVAMRSTAQDLRDKALEVILKSGERGVTADEVAEKLDRSVLAVRPRVSELVKLGLVEKTTERRKNVSGMSASVVKVAV